MLPPGYINQLLIKQFSIEVQGIRNDNQSLSPVTTLVSLVFSDVPNPIQEHF